MVHPWALQGTRPALNPAPQAVSALPLLSAVQARVGFGLRTMSWA